MRHYDHYVYNEENEKYGNRACNVVIAHCNGKSIKGISKCSANDTYDEDYGYNLAKARCDVKLDIKKLKNLEKKIKEVNEQVEAWTNYYNKLIDRYSLTKNTYEADLETLADLETR